MRKLSIVLFLILAIAVGARAEDTLYNTVDQLTQNYFIMAAQNDGTVQSPYWTKANNQNALEGASAIVCGGTVNYYLLKAEAIDYNGETCYRIAIYNAAHEVFPNGVGGGHYLNSAGWVFFSGVCEATGKSHVYGQDFDAGALWRITYAEGKGFQFQCVGNDKYIKTNMAHSSSANKYYWQCYAEGSLYGGTEALKSTRQYQDYKALADSLTALADNTTDLSANDADRQALRDAIEAASKQVEAMTGISDITAATETLRAAAHAFINEVTMLTHRGIDVTFLIGNPSFETGKISPWTYGRPTGGYDVGVKENTGVYATTGTDGNYLFNTYTTSESFVGATKDQYVEQTISRIPVGEYRLKALCASNTYSYGTNSTVELYGNARCTSFVPQSKSSFVKDYETAIYITPTDTALTVGLRSASWFKADNFRLTYYGETEAYETERRLATANRYEAIASQAIDRTAYDAVLSQVKAELAKSDITDTEIAAQNARLRAAIIDLIRTGQTATGQFDITVLLTDTATRQLTGINAETTISQSVAAMPAGHYTFRANALYRPTDTATSMELYAAGHNEHAARIFAGGSEATVSNIFDDPRHAVSGTVDYYSTIDGSGVPTTGGTATAMFGTGHYSTIAETDLATDGDLTVGYRIAATTLGDSWFVAANPRLLYGATPTTTIAKTLRQGVLTPVCLPINLDSETYGQLYAIGSIDNSTATAYPVSHVRAGQPCLISANRDITGFTVPATAVSTRQADIIPLPWDGGTITADTASYSWTVTTTDGNTTTKAESLQISIADPLAMDFTVNLENLQARRFLEQEDYTATTSSHIDRYNVAPPARRDLPNNASVPVTATDSTTVTVSVSENADMSQAITGRYPVNDGQRVYVPNLVPQRTYYYSVMAGDKAVGKGTLHTDGHLRMIYAPSISNIRDLGGWPTAEGYRTRYGLVYRGGELNGAHVATEADLQRLRDLGIGAEIDLRLTSDNSGAGTSAFGFTAADNTYYYANANDYLVENMSADDSRKHWHDEFMLMLDNLRQGRSVYFHCIWGADRTGLLSLLLEGLLGVTEDQSNKNYELTTFSLAGIRWRGTQDAIFTYIRALDGETLQAKFNTFFTESLGVSQGDIDDFRNIMLEKPTATAIGTAPAEAVGHAQIYSLSGIRRANLQQGINIVRLPDGTTRKVIRKAR